MLSRTCSIWPPALGQTTAGEWVLVVCRPPSRPRGSGALSKLPRAFYTVNGGAKQAEDAE
jgi:hypothetical protein